MKKILIIVITLFLVISALGCSRTSKDSASTDTKKATASSVSPTTKATEAIVDKPKEKPSNVLEYKNSNLGFSLTFPGNWKDKYKVVEKDSGIYIFFVPTYKPATDEGGLFFSILPRSKDLDESHLDTVGNERYFEAKGISYVIGGPTDVGFDPNNAEYNIYKQMKANIPEILDTLKNIN